MDMVQYASTHGIGIYPILVPVVVIGCIVVAGLIESLRSVGRGY